MNPQIILLVGPNLDLGYQLAKALAVLEPERLPLVVIHPDPDPYLDLLMDQECPLMLALPKPLEPEPIPSLEQLLHQLKELVEPMPPRLEVKLDLEQLMKQISQVDLLPNLELMEPSPIRSFPPIPIRLLSIPPKRIRPTIRNQLNPGSGKMIGPPEFAPRPRNSWIS